MRIRLILLFITICSFPDGGFSQDPIFYASLNHGIQLGQYDGALPLSALKKNGNFGLGSSDRIASELVLINDTAFSISATDGVKIMDEELLLPFAATKFFKPERTYTLSRSLNLEELEKYLDSLINTNRFAAIKISGIFSSISYKCYLPQTKPYPPIEKAAIKTFDSTAITGNIVCFFTPKSSLVLNNPNYHMHFINGYRTGGGHVSKLRIHEVTIEIDYADELKVNLGDPELLKNVDLNKEKTVK